VKVVVDTNVFVSSFLGTGNPRKIIDLWKQGEITLCLSTEIVEEYVEVLGRLGLADEGEIGEILQLFARGFHTIFTAKTPELKIVEKDPYDDMLLNAPSHWGLLPLFQATKQFSQ
jgi:putative PIN family toxin of toxin-antitoxin system